MFNSHKPFAPSHVFLYMRRQSLKLILVALQAAAVATAFAVQHDDRDSHRSDDHDRGGSRQSDHGRGGYSHDQQGHRRSVDSGSWRGSNSYHGTHNFYHDRGPSVSISVVTPGLIVSFGSPGAHVGFRSGYYCGRPGWADSRFIFGFYVFDYSPTDCAFSPFYYYADVPGYVSLSKVEFGGGASFRFDRRYSWNDRDRLDRDTENAVYDMLDSVNRQDRQALGRLVPSGYWVDVDPHIGKPYSMRSDDFFNLVSDMAQATDTKDYRVLEVRTGRDCAEATFEHDFNDPWGHGQRIYQRVSFDFVGDGYRIARFETSRRGF